MDYGCQISAWVEGISTSLTKDAVDLYDEDKYKGYVPFDISRGISDEELKNFENYFLNVDYDDCYAIGYYFIRFIQREYGESVVLEINDNIKNNVPMPKENYISPSNRNDKADKLFIKAIQDATSKDVFIRFVEEDLKPRMEEKQRVR